MRRTFVAATLGAGCLLAASPALAQGPLDWEIRAVPYVWAAGVDGAVSHPALPAPITAEASFGDVLGRLDIGFMGAVEARKGSFGIMADVIHTRLSDTANLPVLGLPVDLSTSTTTLLAAGQWRVVDAGLASLDVLAGARYWSISTDIAYAIPDPVPLPPGLPLPRVYEGSRGSEWVDGMAGLKARVGLGGMVELTGIAMVGAGGSDSFTDLSLVAGIGLAPRIDLMLGYRRIDVDYSGGSLTFDAAMHGPMVGLGVRF